jgi:hypothetical protein
MTDRDANNNTPADIAIKRGPSHKMMALFFMLVVVGPRIASSFLLLFCHAHRRHMTEPGFSIRVFAWDKDFNDRVALLVFSLVTVFFNVLLWFAGLWSIVFTASPFTDLHMFPMGTGSRQEAARQRYTRTRHCMSGWLSC